MVQIKTYRSVSYKNWKTVSENMISTFKKAIAKRNGAQNCKLEQVNVEWGLGEITNNARQ